MTTRQISGKLSDITDNSQQHRKIFILYLHDMKPTTCINALGIVFNVIRLYKVFICVVGIEKFAFSKGRISFLYHRYVKYLTSLYILIQVDKK